MDRREFIKMLALLAAGAAALPEQIKAFENYYEINTPKGEGEFIAIDNIFFAGRATDPSHVLDFRLSRINYSGEEKRKYLIDKEWVVLRYALNAMATMNWNALPDHKIVGKAGTLKWNVTISRNNINQIGLTFTDAVTASISYIDAEGIRRDMQLETWEGVVG